MVAHAIRFGSCNFWTVLGVLQSQSPVKIHVLGPSKLLLGLIDTRNSLLKARYRKLVTAIGAIFKDSKTRQFRDREVISKPAISSTWKKELVSTMYILDVAPSWYLSDLTEALAPSVHCRYIADRVRWGVAENAHGPVAGNWGVCVTASWEGLPVRFWNASHVL